MRICVFGAGAIGGITAARLAHTGTATVSLVARGDHLAGIQARGLTFRAADETFTVPIKASPDGRDLGPQDVVMVCLKATALAGAADDIARLCHAGSRVVFVQNGIPWWYFHADQSPLAGQRLPRLDPNGALWSLVGPERVIGAVSHHAASVPEPGVVVHTTGRRFYLGQPDGQTSPTMRELADHLDRAGWEAVATPRIRDEIWTKLLGNITSNPISALTLATTDRIFDGAGLEAVVRRMMDETVAIGEALGVRFAMTVDARIALARTLGAFKTSTLQDLEKGRKLELDSLIGVVTDLARLVNTPCPTIDLVWALTRLKATGLRLYDA
jgi:2-dehydropantoate 2-reductase